jgi:hypothetical protein
MPSPKLNRITSARKFNGKLLESKAALVTNTNSSTSDTNNLPIGNYTQVDDDILAQTTADVAADIENTQVDKFQATPNKISGFGPPNVMSSAAKDMTQYSQQMSFFTQNLTTSNIESLENNFMSSPISHSTVPQHIATVTGISSAKSPNSNGNIINSNMLAQNISRPNNSNITNNNDYEVSGSDEDMSQEKTNTNKRMVDPTSDFYSQPIGSQSPSSVKEIPIDSDISSQNKHNSSSHHKNIILSFDPNGATQLQEQSQSSPSVNFSSSMLPATSQGKM